MHTYPFHLLLFLLLGTFCLAAQDMPTEDDPITETEASAFMEEYLELCKQATQTYYTEEDNSQLATFFPPSVRDSENIEYTPLYTIDRYKIRTVRPPWVTVLVDSDPESGHFWNQMLRFKLMKEEGSLFIQPIKSIFWMEVQLSPYHDLTQVHIPFTEQEKTVFQQQSLEALDMAGLNTVSSDAPFIGEWIIASSSQDNSNYYSEEESDRFNKGQQIEFTAKGAFLMGHTTTNGAWLGNGEQFAVRRPNNNTFLRMQNRFLADSSLYCSLTQGDFRVDLYLTRPNKTRGIQKSILSPPIIKGWAFLIPPKYNEINSFSSGLSAVQLDNKWGFVNLDGEEVIDLQYNRVGAFFNGMGTNYLHKDGQSMEMDTSGTIIGTYDYDHMFLHPFGDMIMVRKQGKYGFLNTAKEVILPCEFDVWDVNGIEHFALLREDKWALYNLEGKEILPFEYEEIEYRGEDLAIVKKEGFKGVINIFNKQQIIPNAYQDIVIRGGRLIRAEQDGEITPFFMDGTPLGMTFDVMVWIGDNYFSVRQDGKIGVISDDGTIILPVIYESLNEMEYDQVGYFEVSKNGEIVLMDHSGQQITEAAAEVIAKNRRPTPIMLVQEQQDSVDVPDLDLYPFPKNNYNGEWQGYQNSEGELIVPPVYSYVSYFSDGFGQVERNNYSGLVDRTGQEVLPLIFEEIYIQSTTPQLLWVKLFGKWGLLRRS